MIKKRCQRSRSRPSPPSLKPTRRSCAGRYGRHFPKLAATISSFCCGGCDRQRAGRLSYLTPDRTKPITARKLGTILTRLLSLSCSTERPQSRRADQSHTNTLPRLKAVTRENHKTTRQTTPCSAWLTGKPSEPRARWAMTAGRQSTI